MSHNCSRGYLEFSPTLSGNICGLEVTGIWEGSRCLDVEKKSGNPKAIISQSLGPKKREGPGERNKLFYYSVFIQEVSQLDDCVVIDPKIKWNQLNNSLFLYSWQKISINIQIYNICDLISNNQTSGRINTGIAHVCFSWVVFSFMLDNVYYYSRPALLILYFPCSWFLVTLLTTFNLFVVKQEMTVFWNHGNDSGFL